jgi:hypothetical protein
VIAHIAGVPVEELLPLAYGSGAMLAAARAWASIRRHRGHRR